LNDFASMAQPAERRLAVLIDGENMPARYADAIFDELSRLGEASVRRVYGDILEGGTKPWLEKLAPLAIAPVHQPKNSVAKNASDIALVIDAMDLLNSDRFGGFVLVSSDSDFTKLAQRIREHGVDVYGVGEAKTPKPFRMACKQFITVENLQSRSAASLNPDALNGKDKNHAYQLIANVISGTNDPDGWASLGWLGKQMIQRYPDFDSRTYGEKRLSDLVRSTKKFEEKGEGSAQWVRLKS